mgnify:CR=1 FL=1
MRVVALVALLAGMLQPAPAPRLGHDLHIGEPTQGPVVGLLATVTVASRVEGDVVVLGGDVVVTETGAVREDVVAVAGTVRVAGTVDGRVVGGGSRGVLAPLAGDPARAARSVWGKHLLHMGAWLMVVGGMALLAPQPARRGAEHLARRPLAALVAGGLALLVWVAVVGIGLLLGTTAVGAGVVMAATGALVAVKVLGVAAVAFWLGARLLPWLPAGLRAEAPRAGVGMGVVLLLALLPVAGEVLWLAANVAGIGAVLVMAVTDGLPLAMRVLSPTASRV